MNILDVIVLFIIGLCIVNGYKNGLLYTLYRFISFFAALVLAWFLFPVVSHMLRATPLHDVFSRMVSNAFDLENRAAVYNTTDLINSMPLPEAFKNMLHTNVDLTTHAQSADAIVSSLIASVIINAISIILIFLLVSFGFSFLGGVVNLIGRFPIIKRLNRAGGIILGFLVGGVLSWLALALFIMIVAFAASENLSNLVESSLIVRTLMGGDVVVNRVSP